MGKAEDGDIFMDRKIVTGAVGGVQGIDNRDKFGGVERVTIHFDFQAIFRL